MTTPWNDTLVNATMSEGSPSLQRKKLQLKPRTARIDRQRSTSSKVGSKTDPFGAALPREQVLERRGVDPAWMDAKIERKIHHNRFSKEQDLQIDALRAQLNKVEEELRLANENELPEEIFRVQVEIKRKELQSLMEKFTKENEEAAGKDLSKTVPDAAVHRSRRSNLVQDRDDDEAFGAFASNRRRRGSDRVQQQTI